MEIIKIGNNAVKISLCTEEAKELGIDSFQSIEKLNNSYINLITNVKNGFGYKILDEKVIGEIFSGVDGGCEIFVSKTEAQSQVYRDRNQDENVKKQKPITSIYSFDNLEKLLAITKRLKEIDYDGASSVYYDEGKGKYYIFLDDVSIKDIKFAFISEYSRAVKSSMSLHIKEHFKCLCKKNGVETFSLC